MTEGEKDEKMQPGIDAVGSSAANYPNTQSSAFSECGGKSKVVKSRSHVPPPRFLSKVAQHGCEMQSPSRRTNSVRPNYHSLEIHSNEDLYSPIPELNKYRSASVDESKLRMKQYDDFLNDVNDYIEKDLRDMEEKRNEREYSRKPAAVNASFSGYYFINIVLAIFRCCQWPLSKVKEKNCAQMTKR